MGIFTKLYLFLKKLSDGLNKILEVLVVVLTALMTLTILFQVLYRFVIIKFVSFSFPFTEEFATLLMIWTVYLVIAICLKEGSQASVNILRDNLPEKGRYALFFIIRTLMVVFIITVIYYAVGVIQRMTMFRTPTMQLSGFYLYSAPFVGCVLLGLQIFLEMLGVITKQEKPFEAETMGGAGE